MIYSCGGRCEKRVMYGRSWWKLQGYNFPCDCAVKSLIDYYYEKVLSN
jgi:hypothetical protein